jgi:hypothetical protein
MKLAKNIGLGEQVEKRLHERSFGRYAAAARALKNVKATAEMEEFEFTPNAKLTLKDLVGYATKTGLTLTIELK